MKFLTLSLAKCFSNRVTRTKSHNPSRMRRKKGGDNSMKSFAEVKLNILFIISLRSCLKTWLSLKVCKFWWQQCARCRACISSRLMNAPSLPSETFPIPRARTAALGTDLPLLHHDMSGCPRDNLIIIHSRSAQLYYKSGIATVSIESKILHLQVSMNYANWNRDRLYILIVYRLPSCRGHVTSPRRY